MCIKCCSIEHDKEQLDSNSGPISMVTDAQSPLPSQAGLHNVRPVFLIPVPSGQSLEPLGKAEEPQTEQRGWRSCAGQGASLHGMYQKKREHIGVSGKASQKRGMWEAWSEGRQPSPRCAPFHHLSSLPWPCGVNARSEQG